MKFEKRVRNKNRIKYGVLFIILLVIEILIALFVHDEFIRPYVGDIIVVFVLYTAIRFIIPEKYRLIPLYVFLFATGVEVLQYFNIVAVLGLENNRILSVLVGSVFDIKDIVCYGIGCGLLALYEWRL